MSPQIKENIQKLWKINHNTKDCMNTCIFLYWMEYDNFSTSKLQTIVDRYKSDVLKNYINLGNHRLTSPELIIKYFKELKDEEIEEYNLSMGFKEVDIK